MGDSHNHIPWMATDAGCAVVIIVCVLCYTVYKIVELLNGAGVA